jgi:hypothetical protein
MKNILFFVFAFSVSQSFSQDSLIPKIEWEGVLDSTNQYVDLLKVKDNNSLIVKWSITGDQEIGSSTNYVVFLNNRKVKKYFIYNLRTETLKPKINRKKIKKREYEFYWALLNKCILEKKLHIEESQLNIERRRSAKEIDKENGTILEIIEGGVSHGSDYHFNIFQGKKYITFHSFAPEYYIEEKFPGFEERQKLVDLMNEFQDLIDLY